MTEKREKSVIPVYGVAAAWLLYCAIFPLYKTWHFVVLACFGALAYVVLSAVFPGKTIQIAVPEEPVSTGDEAIDALLAEGEKNTGEMRKIRGTVPDGAFGSKLDEIIAVTDSIFKRLVENPGDYKQVKRFAEFYLPTTMKLLSAYTDFAHSGSGGENITSAMERIDLALDTIADSYRKFFDSLFAQQALDIETDIIVLEAMLKNEGLLDNKEMQNSEGC